MTSTGNVWEWCSDWYGNYSDKSVTDPTGPKAGKNRVRRGGGWSRHAPNCRSNSRSSITPEDRYSDLGFRVALAAVQQ